MATKTQIANLTLQMLGEENTITNLTENTKAARAINGCYDIILDKTLRAHNWNFAIKRDELPALVDTPPFGYGQKYQLPGDCLRMVQVGQTRTLYSEFDYPAGDEMPYQIEGRLILTDFQAPLPVRYIYRVTDPAQFDACFVPVFAVNMAMQTCKHLTGSNTLKESLREDRKMFIREAKLMDAIENPPEPGAANSWLTARI